MAASERKQKSRLGRGLSSLMASPVAVEVPEKGGAGSPQDDDAGPPSSVDGRGDGGQSRAVAGMPSASNAADHLPDHGSARDVSHETPLLHLAVANLEPNPFQPRRRFAEGPLAELAASIRQQGLMQPVVVRADDVPGQYQIIAGERRWRAAQQAGLEQIPALLVDLDDQQAAQWALVENLQREDLGPIERARAFARLIKQFGLTQAQVAERVGIDRSSVANFIRLLDLPEPVLDHVEHSRLTMGQARALAGLAEAELQIALAQQVVTEGWTVRRIEQKVKSIREGGQADASSGSSATGKTSTTRSHLADLEAQISEQLGTKVRISAGRKKGTGTLAIDFYSLDQFDDLLAKLDVQTS